MSLLEDLSPTGLNNAKITQQTLQVDNTVSTNLIFCLKWKMESLSKGSKAYDRFEEALRAKRLIENAASVLGVLHLLEIRIEVKER